MDGANKGSSPKPSPVHKPSYSGESNENELSNNQLMDSTMQNPKKPTKHFMSPTISAASKAAVPRKKILGERNEASTISDTHLQKGTNVGSRTGPLKSRNSSSGRSSPRVMSSFNCASESDDDENNALVVDSSLKPYDPLTNYLSPRPKYLRYKPNRRHEIICRLENEIAGEKDGIDVNRSGSFDLQKVVDEEVSSADAQDSSPPPLEEGYVKPDDDKIEKKKDSDDEVEEDEEEEVEEFEEEGWSLKGIMKFLLVMLTLFLSTSYILSMNSPTPSYAQQALWNLKDGYNRIQEHILKDVAVKMFGDGNGSPDPMLPSELRAFDVDQTMIEDPEFEEVEVVEDDKEEGMETDDEQVEMVEPIDGQSEDVLAHQVDETDEALDQLTLTENAKSEHGHDGEVEIKQEASDQLPGSGMAEHDDDAVDHEVEKAIEDSDLKEQESGKNCGFLEESETQLHQEMVDDHDTENDTPRSSVNNNYTDSGAEGDSSEIQSQAEPAEEIFEEIIEVGGLVKSEIEKAEVLISKTGDEIVVSARMENALIESETTNSDRDVGSMEVKNMAIGLVTSAIVVVILSTISASLVLFYRSRKATRVAGEQSQPSQIRPMEKSIVTERLAPVVPRVEERHIEKNVESFEKPSLLFDDPSEKTPQETSRVHAPNVVLLGELVVGEVSSSLKSCDRKSKMIESEESNNFVFQEKALQMNTHSASTPRPQPAVEFSTADSPSYGSFTAEKKILTKEKGKDAEVKVAVTTPVRRSSRIRNRAVMSP